MSKFCDNQTIIVAPDNPAKHSQYDTQIIKAFYVTNGPIDLVNVVSLVRLRLRTRFVSQSLAAPAIVIRRDRRPGWLRQKTSSGL